MVDSKQIKTSNLTQQEVEWVKVVLKYQDDDPKAKELIEKIKKSRSLFIS
ncbi:hypothetical protein SMD22_06300 [Brevibacillus halotolerans]|nr:hypothetical protein [Brevibacillus halotolerans]MBA4535146.1 hypothetical protein [Brevibacillus halotolerans]WPS88560.1 hypothetical protein SMD22_06300 [Brevibacillus halotolerans]